MIYFAKYQPSTGFKFSLDGYHNVPNTSLPLIGLYCLNPPAAFYSGNFDPKSILLNSNFDWDSPLSSPKYNEGFFTWRDLPFNKYLNIIVDVRTVSISERKDKVREEKEIIKILYEIKGFLIRIYKIIWKKKKKIKCFLIRKIKLSVHIKKLKVF